MKQILVSCIYMTEKIEEHCDENIVDYKLATYLWIVFALDKVS